MYTQVHYCNSINISSEIDNSNLLSFQPVCMHYKFAIIHTKISQTRSTHPCNPRVSQCCIKLTSNEPLNFSCLLPWSRGVYLPRTTLLSWSFFWLGACLGTSATNLSMSRVACPTIQFITHSSILILLILLNMEVSGMCPTLHILIFGCSGRSSLLSNDTTLDTPLLATQFLFNCELISPDLNK